MKKIIVIGMGVLILLGLSGCREPGIFTDGETSINAAAPYEDGLTVYWLDAVESETKNEIRGLYAE